MICGNCDKTDGMVYTSMPPKMRCGISKRFHERGDECEFEWKPIIHGHWVHIGGDEWCCSECGFVVTTEGSWEHPKERGYDYCYHCGANIDEVEE